MKKTIGILIICSLGLAILGGLSDAGDGFYQFIGLCFFITGIWGGVLLIKS